MGFFFKYDSKQKFKYKLTHDFFFRSFICLIHPRSSDYSRKCHYFFFLFLSKLSVLLYHSHLHQVFTILSLPSIHQPTINNQFEALNAPKFRFLLFISHYLCTQTTSLSLSLYIHHKKPKILILNFVKFKLIILGH